MTQKENQPVLLLVSIIYLFFNSFLLPEGLLYTTLLTPFFLINLIRTKGIQVYAAFLLLTLLMAAVQLPSVEFLRDYVKSFILMQTVAIFVINTWYVLQAPINLTGLFKQLGTVNLVLLIVSLICLFIPVLRPWLWYEMSMSEGLPILPRLKMLTYEASYYSLIIAPLFSYYFLRRFLLHGKTGILLVSLFICLVLSLSFGVLIALFAALFLVLMFNLNELLRRVNLNYLSAGIVLMVGALVAAYFLFPHNFIFERLANIYQGKDTSARGRTTESFVLAWDIAKIKSAYFGIGLGQLKMIGREYIIQYYSYMQIPPVIRIPNAVAETLNIFGLTGIGVRFTLIVFLFFKTRVWNNYYRLTLFLFIFIYQFTGSYLFNVAEYMVWILAFSPAVSRAFDREHFVRTERFRN